MPWTNSYETSIYILFEKKTHPKSHEFMDFVKKKSIDLNIK